MCNLDFYSGGVAVVVVAVAAVAVDVCGDIGKKNLDKSKSLFVIRSFCLPACFHFAKFYIPRWPPWLTSAGAVGPLVVVLRRREGCPTYTWRHRTNPSSW